MIGAFLDSLATDRKLSASSVNHHRTILNSVFNFAMRRGRFDKNPVAAVRQRPEPLRLAPQHGRPSRSPCLAQDVETELEEHGT
jgi:site-specific recombinase XerD